MVSKLIFCFLLLGVATAQFNFTQLSITTCYQPYQVSFDPTNSSLLLEACNSVPDRVNLYSVAQDTFNLLTWWQPGTVTYLTAVKFYPRQSTYALAAFYQLQLTILQINTSALTPLYTLNDNHLFYDIDISSTETFAITAANSFLNLYNISTNSIALSLSQSTPTGYSQCWGILLINDTAALLTCKQGQVFQYSITTTTATLQKDFSIPDNAVNTMSFISGSNTFGIYLSTNANYYTFNYNGASNQLNSSNGIVLGNQPGYCTFNADNTRMVASFFYGQLILFSTGYISNCQTIVSSHCTSCNFGYYLATSTSCIACSAIDSQCTACSQTSNICTACASGYFLANTTSCQLQSSSGNSACQIGYYFESDTCWPCPAQCASCYNATTCSACAGTTNPVQARILSNNCQCPSNYYDNILNSLSSLSCVSSCANSYLTINNQCILNSCLSIDLSINFNSFQFSLTATTDSLNDTQYNLWVNYTGVISPVLSSCYQTYIYFVQSNGSMKLAPSIFDGNNLHTAFLQTDLVATYGCAQTSTSTAFIYNCSLSYQAYILGLQQININFAIGITLNRATANILSLGVNELTNTQSCVSCDTQYSVGTSTQLVNSDGTVRANTTYSIGQAMIFLVQIQDPSLRALYYVDLVSVTITSGSISFTVTPASAIQSVLGQLTVNVTASLAIPNATLTIIGQLSLTPSRRILGGRIEAAVDSELDNFYQLMRPAFLRSSLYQKSDIINHGSQDVESQNERRVLQSSTSQLLRASYQISIVDPSQSQNGQQLNASSQNSQGSNTKTILLIVITTAVGIAIVIIVAYVIYQRMCKNGKQSEQSDKSVKNGQRNSARADVYRDEEEDDVKIDKEEDKIQDMPKVKLQPAINQLTSKQILQVK